MPGPSPLNSACRCCLQPPTTSIGIQYVSVSQSCTTCSCGETPCTSTEAQYDNEGNCTSAAQVCSPDYASLTRAEKCANKKYLTVTTVDMSGGGFHGGTQVRQYTTDQDCGCDLGITCSGSTTTVTKRSHEPGPPTDSPYPGCSQEFSASGNTTITDTKTYNQDCTASSDNPTCSGTSSSSESLTCVAVGGGNDGEVLAELSVSCESTLGENCEWSGTTNVTCCSPGAPTESYPQSGSCVGMNKLDSVETTPAPSCTVTVTYSGPNEQGFCTPKQFPSFPAFTQCTPEGEEPPEPPELQPGQGYGAEAYKYENPYNPQIKSEQKVKYRVEHGPTGTCYLKVWFRKRIQQWKYEDCDTGFSGDPPRTPPANINCNENGGSPCYSRWSTDGEPTFQDDGNYEWKGSGYPCYKEDDKVPEACENKIYGTQVKNLTAGQNQSVTIEIKYSFVEDYEPNWPDENGSQGCKPNRFPIADPEECPEYDP